MDRMDILALDEQELKNLLLDMGEKAFRADQIFSWLHKQHISDFSEMTNISKALRENLDGRTYLPGMTCVTQQVSKEDGTSKFLFQLRDGHYIESVLMKYDHGNSVCISTQAGCRMGCTFCASGLLGLERNLTTGEMLEQIYAIERMSQLKVSHIVLMGTGEPLDNLEHVLRFLKLVTHEKGNDISMRHITVSTCGLVDKMDELAEYKLQLTLAISLHASNNALRMKTMPIARKYDIEALLSACERYFKKTGRRITFEYSLIEGVNDDLAMATELAQRLKSRDFACHVNLIPINPVKEKGYAATRKEAISAFRNVLTSKGVETTIRRSLGGDIDAACGQLRLSTMKSEK